MAYLTCASGQKSRPTHSYLNCDGAGYQAKQVLTANDYVIVCSNPPLTNPTGLIICPNSQYKKFSELTIDDGYLLQVPDGHTNELVVQYWWDDPNFYNSKIGGVSSLQLSNGLPSFSSSRSQSSNFDLSGITVSTAEMIGFGVVLIGALSALIFLRKSIKTVNRV